MTTYEITISQKYTVEANDPAEAIEKIAERIKTDAFFIAALAEIKVQEE